MCALCHVTHGAAEHGIHRFGCALHIVRLQIVKMADDVKQYLNNKGVQWEEARDLKAVAAEVDVVYQTRIQRERFAENPEDYEKARGRYVVDSDLLKVLIYPGVFGSAIPSPT
jgi:aspartate carbamoyltransferase catalytic subunit